MRSVYRSAILVLTSILFYQCQKEVSYKDSGGHEKIVLSSPLTANLQGNVFDENEQPAANVVVKVGSEITTTDAKGYFRINNAPLDKNAALVTAEKTGYFIAYRSFSATSGTNQVAIKLTRKNLSGTVSGSDGGDINLNNGTKISLPANGVVKAFDNSNYTGTVNVYAAYIDPTSSDILDKVPGSFMANDKNGKRVLLSSYGMVAVELESSAGEKLQIKSGNTATLTSPIPSSLQSSAPATISLWYVDESTGLWKEEGAATKQGSNYIGTVKHFTYWNCDVSVPTVTLSAIFKTAKGQPLVNAKVVFKSNGGNFVGSTYGYTDSLGQLNGPVPTNLNLLLEVIDECRTKVYSKNVGPYGKSSDLGIVTIPAQTSSLITIQGRLANCSGTPVTKGYAIITNENWMHYAKVDGNGNFSTNFLLCNVNAASVQILGVDETTQQQGIIIVGRVTTPTTDVGSFLACGSLSAQYINYQIDTNSYSITDADSLTAFISPFADFGRNYIGGIQTASGNSMSFTFNTFYNAIKGTYYNGEIPELQTLRTQNFTNWWIVKPLNVTITTFPQTVGDFYEGNFKGQFIDVSNNTTHSVTCFFRVRRQK